MVAIGAYTHIIGDYHSGARRFLIRRELTGANPGGLAIGT